MSLSINTFLSFRSGKGVETACASSKKRRTRYYPATVELSTSLEFYALNDKKSLQRASNALWRPLWKRMQTSKN